MSKNFKEQYFRYKSSTHSLHCGVMLQKVKQYNDKIDNNFTFHQKIYNKKKLNNSANN